jgi:coenzyme F420 hydrogenase subunit beta
VVRIEDTSGAGPTIETRLSYDESWGEVLQKHRQWRCHVCADHTGEFADVAVGDPWYREIPVDEPGRSLVVVRTERGREAVRSAVADGVPELEPVPPDILVRSQPNLLRSRGAVWGRIMAMRSLGLPAPRYEGLPMFPVWRDQLDTRQKGQSFLGTVKRVVLRRLYRRSPVRADPGTVGRRAAEQLDGTIIGRSS